MKEKGTTTGRRCQFGLRTLLVIVTLFAVFAGAWSWFRWRTSTRHMRELYEAIASSSMDRDDKELLGRLVWSQRAWDSGLIRSLVGPPVVKRIVWRSTFLDRARTSRHVFVLDSFIRPVAGAQFPLTCVVTDLEYRLVTWDTVAPWSVGFMDANLKNGVLTITTRSNWFAGKGTYKYDILGDQIVSHGEGEFEGYADTDKRKREPPFLTDNPHVKDVIKRMRLRP